LAFSLLLGGGFLLFDLLDDTDSNGLLHVSNGESTEGRILGEDFDAHGLVGGKGDHTTVAGLDELGVFFKDLTGSSVDLGLDFSELASNMGGVTIQDGAVTVLDLTGMVEDDNLSIERDGFSGGIVLGITTDVTSSDILDGDTLDVETNVVTGNSFGHGFVMHFN